MFSKSERKLIEMIGNPEWFSQANLSIDYILKEKYDAEKVIEFNKQLIDSTIKKVMTKARDSEKSKRILQLILKGMDKAIFVDEVVTVEK